jgi:hypothetical protein
MRIGPYEITGKLGAGGMGEVYRARDPRLGRDVAVKVLPQDVAKDEGRLRRFELEARAAGALNHPNVLTIFDIGSQEGSLYVVSEVLDGTTLGEEIRNGPLPVRKVLDYAGQMARGLAAAHEKGIFHRDLKPDNVFVTTDGRVKILDFGLAKLSERIADPSGSMMPTLATEPGVVLGTAGYMSPEQVRGQEVDHRSDIFSFGAVLYEMITGRRAFIGDSSVETMNAILKEEPPELSDDPRLSVPPALDRIVRHCLEKRPEQRFQSAQDLAFGLETQSTSGTAAAVVSERAGPKARSRQTGGMAAAILFVVAVAVITIRWFSIPAPQTSWSGVLLGGPETAMSPRMSPDGKTLAFLAMINNQTQVAVMEPTKGNWTVLTQDRTRGAAHHEDWSADGSRIYFDRYFSSSSNIFSVPALGGDERLVLENAGAPLPLPDGSLLVSILETDGDFALYRFWPETGKLGPMGVILADEGAAHTSRDGGHVLFRGRLEKKAPTQQLYDLDISSRKAIPVTGLPPGDTYGSAIGDSPGVWLTQQMSGDLIRIIRFSTGAKATAVHELVALTHSLYAMDSGPDGSLYVDQLTRPSEVIRFGLSGGIPERLAFSERATSDQGGALLLSDGRVLSATEFSGHPRLVAGRPGERVFPFVETSDDTTVPVALVGDEQVACLIGPSTGSQTIAIVSAGNGQILRRLNGALGKPINTIAASPDGKTLYFAGAHTIWAIPSTDGEPRKLAAGDGVAPSPDGEYLIIQINEKDGPHLARLPVSGGEPQPIRLDLGGFRLWLAPLSPNAVAADGRIIDAVDSPDSWFETAVVIEPRTGRVERIPTTFSGDIHSAGWTKDGRVIATGLPIQSSLWRFVSSGQR